MTWNEHLSEGEYCPHCFSKKGYKVEIIVSGELSRCALCMRDLLTPRREVVRVPIKLDRKGKMVTCTIHNRKGLEGADIHLFAVGKPMGKTYFEWWRHTPELAPSSDLVTFAKRHNHLVDKDEQFQVYTEYLLDEWMGRPDFLDTFAQLIRWIREGNVVAVACYCHPLKRSNSHRRCHLCILSDLVRDMGCEVEEAPPYYVGGY